MGIREDIKNGLIWYNCTKLVNPPPEKERFGTRKVILMEIFGKKGVKYAIKTVIYKSWDWVRPPLLGTKSQLLPKICFGGFP